MLKKSTKKQVHGYLNRITEKTTVQLFKSILHRNLDFIAALEMK
jgi:hypothetical protein